MRRPEAARLTVIAGPMFAGKTEELLRRVHRSRLAGLRVDVIGHRLDDRAGPGRLSTHIGRSTPARMLGEARDVLEVLDGERPDKLAIDEAQFFGPSIVPVIEQLLEAGIDVEVAGLCVTYDGEPFDPVPALMAVAEEAVKLTAVCAVCGADAALHVRLAGEAGDALRPTAEQVGGSESYQARCRSHRLQRPDGARIR
ncbi:thymidine kinase [Brachybacterium sp. GCM10030252]|uniref:thymidine kinase n=1 Tax=Brachybacterium sp. GCM10030252 TaxID=3273380 RepID=UPI00360CD2F6